VLRELPEKDNPPRKHIMKEGQARTLTNPMMFFKVPNTYVSILKSYAL